ncbi:TonB-dependent receptor plug domain-containing protein [Pseudoalteromonas sp. S16_S37]|uniref:TonB-dependent receptor plug domain-containing protein n=1 Tax=Pseudoalteromonas sp. S16_S37 TaxID=2720228 RepID=UPI0016817FAC|nr:TonB-dependent receptor [Pseudoalteromonas sp. S16_S37]MBD1582952.1 TonB-dependent receptor [Pseudoalteromonas sp. S16_S37]
MINKYFAAALCIAALTSRTALCAPLPDLEDLLDQQLNQLPTNTQVSAASRIERSSSDSMAVTHVITDKDIRQFNLQSLADILALFVGTTTRDDTSFTYLSARGIGRPGDFNSRFLFLLDGTRMNENLLDAGLLGYENFVDVGLIERVEYSPGASAALYGNNALLGVINIVTKTTSKLGDVNIAASTTNDGAKHARVTTGFRSASGSDSWLSLSKTQLDSIAYPVLQVPPELIKWQHLNNEESTRIMFSHQTGNLQFQAAGSKRARNFPDGFSLFKNNIPELEKIQNDAYFLALTFDDKISNDIEAYFHMSTHGNDYERDAPLTFPDGNIIFERTLNSGRWSNIDGQLVFLGLDAHELMVGFDFQKDHRQEFSSIASIPSEFDLYHKSNESRYGLYIQDLWRLSPELKFQWALRHDNSDFSTARWSPSFTLKYQFADSHNLLIRHSRAFRVTNFLERNANSVFDIPAPDNETLKYSEVSLVQRWSSSFSSFATIYQSNIKNLIHRDIYYPTYFNTPPIKSRGLEFGVDKRWHNGMSLVANMAFQRSELNGGFDIGNSPKFIGQLRFSVPLGKSGFLLSLHSHAVSKRESFGYTLPKFSSHDASLSWQSTNKLSIALGVRNITDEEVLDITGDGFIPYVQRRRQVHLSVNWSWDND